RELKIDGRQNGLRRRQKLRLPTRSLCLLLGPALGAAKRNIRRPPKRNIEQVGQQDDEPPPARRQRLSPEPTQAAEAAGTEETPAIDSSTPCPGPCPGCMRWLPLSAFPRRSDGARARQCARCNATQANRRPRQDPEQTAPLDEQDADGQDDGPPPASPRQETPAVDSVRQRNLRLPRPQTPLPHIQENVAPQPVRRSRQSSASANADRAAAERRRTAAVEEALAAALRTAEATTRQARGADAARAAEADVEAARRALTASQAARRALTASQEARRAAVLQESMAAAAEEARRASIARETVDAAVRAAGAQVEAARLAARDAANAASAAQAAAEAGRRAARPPAAFISAFDENEPAHNLGPQDV
ncbi:hypothetical protein E4U45_000821, partial [Claviceps purpurea]